MRKGLSLISTMAVLLLPVTLQAGAAPNAAVPTYAGPAETVLKRHMDTRGIAMTTGSSYVNGSLEHRYRVSSSSSKSWHNQIQDEVAYAETAMANGNNRAACKAISRAISLEKAYNKTRDNRLGNELYEALKGEYCA